MTTKHKCATTIERSNLNGNNHLKSAIYLFTLGLFFLAYTQYDDASPTTHSRTKRSDEEWSLESFLDEISQTAYRETKKLVAADSPASPVMEDVFDEDLDFSGSGSGSGSGNGQEEEEEEGSGSDEIDVYAIPEEIEEMLQLFKRELEMGFVTDLDSDTEHFGMRKKSITGGEESGNGSGATAENGDSDNDNGDGDEVEEDLMSASDFQVLYEERVKEAVIAYNKLRLWSFNHAKQYELEGKANEKLLDRLRWSFVKRITLYNSGIAKQRKDVKMPALENAIIEYSTLGKSKEGQEKILSMLDDFLVLHVATRNEKRFKLCKDCPDFEFSIEPAMEGYGCYCDFSNPLSHLSSSNQNFAMPEPVDDLDKICRDIRNCYSCAKLEDNCGADDEDLEASTIAGAYEMARSILTRCQFKNRLTNNKCDGIICSCEFDFVHRYIDHVYTAGGINKTYLHQSPEWNREAMCAKPKSSSEMLDTDGLLSTSLEYGGNADQDSASSISRANTDSSSTSQDEFIEQVTFAHKCCGPEYPVRKPFYNLSSKKQCCGMKTYDFYKHSCCQTTEGEKISGLGQC